MLVKDGMGWDDGGDGEEALRSLRKDLIIDPFTVVTADG